MRFPRVAKAQPWAGIGERFQRYSFFDKFSQKWVAFRFIVQRSPATYLDGTLLRIVEQRGEQS
jgi:hypothetical protein